MVALPDRLSGSMFLVNVDESLRFTNSAELVSAVLSPGGSTWPGFSGLVPYFRRSDSVKAID
jgi:hypothetical protein